MGITNDIVSDILDNRGLVRISYQILKYPAPFRATATPFDNTNYPVVDEAEEEDITSFVKDWGINKSQGMGAAQLSLEVPFDPEDGSSPTFEPNDVIVVFERMREEASLKSSGWVRHGIFLIDDYPKSVDDYTWRITATDGFKITTTKKFVGTFEADTVDYDRDSTTLTQVDQGSYFSYVHAIDAGIPFDDRWYNWAAEPPPLIYWRENPGDIWQRLFENDNVQVIKSAGEVRINKEYFEELFDDGAGGFFTPTISITYSRYKAEFENTDFAVWNSARSVITEVLLDAGFHEEAEDFPALFFIPSDERFTEPRYETKFDKVWDFQTSGSVFTDATDEAGDLTIDDIILPGAVGDILYLGAINRHREILFEISTAGIAGSRTYVWEYWDGAAYQPVAPTEDETNGFTQSGRVKFGVFPSTGIGAKFNTVNSAGPYWYLRLRCTAVNNVEIAHWKLDDADGTGFADEIGSYNVVHGDTNNITYEVSAEDGDGAGFNGSDSTIDLGDIAELDAVSAFTILFWMNQNVADDPGWIFRKRQSGSIKVECQITAGGMRLEISTAVGGSSFAQFDLTDEGIEDSEWNHVVWVYDGTQFSNEGKLKAYVNGVLALSTTWDGTIPASTDANSANMILGNAVGSFNGTFDDWRIFDFALTETQINSIMGFSAIAKCRRILISAGVVLPKIEYKQDDDRSHQKVINDILDFCKPNYVIRVDNNSHVRTYEVVQKTARDYRLDTIENSEVAGSDKDLFTKIVYRGRIPDPVNVALDSEGSVATAFFASAIRQAKKRIGRRAEPETPIDGSSMTFMEWHFNATGGTPSVLDDQHVLWKLVLNGGSPVTIGEGTRFLVSGGPSVASWTIEWSNDDVTYDYFSYDAIDVAIPDGNPLEIEGGRILPSTVTYLRFRCTQFHIEQDLDTGIGGVDEEIIQEASLREVVLFENDVIRKTAELGVTPPFNTATFIARAKRLQPRELILDVDEFAATEFYVEEKARLWLRYSYRQFDAMKISALRPDAEIHESLRVVIPQESIDQIYVVEDLTKGKGGVCELYLVRYEPDG